MVALVIVIVDINAALIYKSSNLHLIKQRYPFVVQLFHFRKSHCVHLIGPEVAHNDMVQAANEFG
ncbi:Hypothetical protein, putative [Bodo saltans]|uniref:Uncharacterized protein n=1 Tax=Bodo saltans TaxID=75058 RepID=A0A0S4J2B6_BODSA|nr:Hypothetical protein, putative [Bodo saltans]|eukprot:CUG19735.1 Hypothetical protein, putative [Bodo saltans]